MVQNQPGTTKLSSHSGSGTLRGGGVKRIYGNMASLKQYKQKIDYRLPLVTIFCLASIASILFLYGLYQLKGHDNLVDYVKSTRDIAEFIENPQRHKRQFESDGNQEPTVDDAPTAAELEQEIHDEQESAEKDEQKGTSKKEAVETTTTTTTVVTSTVTTTEARQAVTLHPNPNWISASELGEMYDRLNSTYVTIWNLFALNLVALLFLVPATIIFHLDYCGIAKYKIIFRVILVFVLLFLFVQLLYLISPVLRSAFAFPVIVDRLFDKNTEPKHERGVSDIKENFACDFDVHPALIEHGIQDSCLPKIKDSLFPSYATIMLIFLDILPFLFAGFTYAWDAWLKDCTAVREARMRVELNQRRPQPREQVIHGINNGHTWSQANTIQVT